MAARPTVRWLSRRQPDSFVNGSAGLCRVGRSQLSRSWFGDASFDLIKSTSLVELSAVAHRELSGTNVFFREE